MKYKTLFSEAKAANLAAGRPPQPQHHFLYEEQAEARNFVLAGKAHAAHLHDQGVLENFRSIECQIMDWADDAAYSLHDIQDGIRTRMITPDALDLWVRLRTEQGQPPQDIALTQLASLKEAIRSGNTEALFGRRIGDFIRACSLQPQENRLSPLTQRHAWRLAVAPDAQAECRLYKHIARDLLFRSMPIQQIEFRGGFLLGRMFEAFFEHHVTRAAQGLRLLPPATTARIEAQSDSHAKARLICDYLADMTDLLAPRLYKRLFDPDYGSLHELT